MAISEMKLQMVIDNYFKDECDINTSIKQAFEKGFRIGVKKGTLINSSDRPQGQWTDIYQLSIDGSMTAQCKNCKEKIIFRDKAPNFCPHCGARMKGENDETD